MPVPFSSLPDDVFTNIREFSRRTTTRVFNHEAVAIVGGTVPIHVFLNVGNQPFAHTRHYIDQQQIDPQNVVTVTMKIGQVTPRESPLSTLSNRTINFNPNTFNLNHTWWKKKLRKEARRNNTGLGRGNLYIPYSVEVHTVHFGAPFRRISNDISLQKRKKQSQRRRSRRSRRRSVSRRR